LQDAIGFLNDANKGTKGMDTGPFIVSFLNRKGGVGKTSTVFHLAGSFAGVLGKRVLLCDLDPQASLSQGYFGPVFVESLPKGKTVAALFDDSFDPSPDDLVYPTGFENISIVPASNDLTDHNTPRPEESRYQDSLRDFLEEAKVDFDVVLIDCPPNLQLCSWAALLASDFVVVPVIPEDFSSQGLVYVQQAIDRALFAGNPKLRLLGYMLTIYEKRIGIHGAYDKLLRGQYRDLVLENVMPLNTAFKEAVSRRRPIFIDKPKSAAATATNALCRELLDRAPDYASRRAEFYYAGNRYVPGVVDPQEPQLQDVALGAGEGD
jgi:chromosome partitioning protein